MLGLSPSQDESADGLEFYITHRRVRIKKSPLNSETIITINVPLFKKLRDIIVFLRDNNFLSHSEGHFEGAKTFLTP
jgi:hypothetical protein